MFWASHAFVNNNAQETSLFSKYLTVRTDRTIFVLLFFALDFVGRTPSFCTGTKWSPGVVRAIAAAWTVCPPFQAFALHLWDTVSAGRLKKGEVAKFRRCGLQLGQGDPLRSTPTPVPTKTEEEEAALWGFT
ncbi:hypothetical protein NL676_003472 [Syzygium grande]|nr:hypothetical protein NL676_003472 [Syzygium grande]